MSCSATGFGNQFSDRVQSTQNQSILSIATEFIRDGRSYKCNSYASDWAGKGADPLVAVPPNNVPAFEGLLPDRVSGERWYVY